MQYISSRDYLNGEVPADYGLFHYCSERDRDLTGYDIHGLGIGMRMLRPQWAVDSVAITFRSPRTDEITTIEACQMEPAANFSPLDIDDNPIEVNPEAEKPLATSNYTEDQRFASVITAIEPSTSAIWGTAETNDDSEWQESYGKLRFAGYDYGDVGSLFTLFMRSVRVYDAESGEPRYLRPVGLWGNEIDADMIMSILPDNAELEPY